MPTTFNEMLLFNASVMGYGSSTWMNIVLQQFDDMATRPASRACLALANMSILLYLCSPILYVLTPRSP